MEISRSEYFCLEVTNKLDCCRYFLLVKGNHSRFFLSAANSNNLDDRVNEGNNFNQTN
jgi:hypothetical protein